MEAIKKDQEGDMASALSLYSKALEYFVPALRYERDAQRKEAIRSKVSDYISRAEQLKALVASDNKTLLQKGCPGRDILKGKFLKEGKISG
ncbi:serine/threonine-protein kinase ULK3-like [Notechis scutatus]|uniref:Serine/threonine-protein kinase ULK3-like n=1 Tax=Notechis scutatus TaxID=8663 RepID=A0A6J1W919_9SAUR|nr:serine/threonine-protein kinase ULK3-like [Notechis scutatus]